MGCLLGEACSLFDGMKEQQFLSWFGERVPHRHSAFYKEEYRPLYIKTRAGKVIEIPPSDEAHKWPKNDSGQYEIPEGRIFKFGPYIYQALDISKGARCYSCDLGFHCSCMDVNCSCDRADGEWIRYKRLVVHPENLKALNGEWKSGTWEIKLHPILSVFKSWPKSGCTVSFMLYIRSEDNWSYWILWDEDSGQYWTVAGDDSVPVRIDDFKIDGKSFKAELDKCFHEELDKRGFNQRNGAIESLDTEPLPMRVVYKSKNNMKVRIEIDTDTEKVEVKKDEQKVESQKTMNLNEVVRDEAKGQAINE